MYVRSCWCTSRRYPVPYADFQPTGPTVSSKRFWLFSDRKNFQNILNGVRFALFEPRSYVRFFPPVLIFWILIAGSQTSIPLIMTWRFPPFKIFDATTSGPVGSWGSKSNQIWPYIGVTGTFRYRYLFICGRVYWCSSRHKRRGDVPLRRYFNFISVIVVA